MPAPAHWKYRKGERCGGSTGVGKCRGARAGLLTLTSQSGFRGVTPGPACLCTQPCLPPEPAQASLHNPAWHQPAWHRPACHNPESGAAEEGGRKPAGQDTVQWWEQSQWQGGKAQNSARETGQWWQESAPLAEGSRGRDWGLGLGLGLRQRLRERLGQRLGLRLRQRLGLGWGRG